MKQFYDQSWQRPIIMDVGDLEYNYPLCMVNGKIQRMIPMREFMERLETSKLQTSYNTRAVDNE